MIEYIKGILIKKSISKIIIEVNSIGYIVNVSNSTINVLPDQGKEVKLYISESNNMYSNTNIWYGFLHQDEKELFEIIKSVDKIGSKGALDILSRLNNNIHDFKIFLVNQDINKLNEVFGFTKKKAEKLVLGLKDKIMSIDIEVINTRETKANFSNINKNENDAVEALKSLGYNVIAAKKVISDIMKTFNNNESTSLENIIKMALKRL